MCVFVMLEVEVEVWGVPCACAWARVRVSCVARVAARCAAFGWAWGREMDGEVSVSSCTYFAITTRHRGQMGHLLV